MTSRHGDLREEALDGARQRQSAWSRLATNSGLASRRLSAKVRQTF